MIFFFLNISTHQMDTEQLYRYLHLQCKTSGKILLKIQMTLNTPMAPNNIIKWFKRDPKPVDIFSYRNLTKEIKSINHNFFFSYSAVPLRDSVDTNLTFIIFALGKAIIRFLYTQQTHIKRRKRTPSEYRSCAFTINICIYLQFYTAGSDRRKMTSTSDLLDPMFSA